MFYAPDSGTERPSENIGLLSKWYLNEFAAMYSSILLEYSPEINYKTIIWMWVFNFSAYADLDYLLVQNYSNFI